MKRMLAVAALIALVLASTVGLCLAAQHAQVQVANGGGPQPPTPPGWMNGGGPQPPTPPGWMNGGGPQPPTPPGWLG